MTEETPLRILSLDVENILRVVAVHIEPTGRVVELTGKNRNGKSSTIDALWMALGGEKMIPPDPIHDGAEEGLILVDIGDDAGTKYKVRRKIRKADNERGFATSLIIEGADGAKFSNPQKILNSLIGSLSCDPLKFIGMEPEDQYDLLKKFVHGFDFDAWQTAYDVDFNKRTEVNRDAKRIRAQADGITLPADAPASRVDEAALVAELAGAADKNAAVERFRAEQERRARDIRIWDDLAEAKRRQIAELQARIKKLEEEIETHETAAENERLEISDAVELTAVDTTDLQAKIAEARATNAAFEAAERASSDKDRLEQEALKLENQSAALTKALKDREDAKETAIAEAKLPVPGIAFGDGILLLDGHPLSQASQAQKLSVAIAIAVALQPRLRFVTTKNAALLDDDSWKALVNLAEQQDLLVIAETVQSDRPTAVVIEDGHVRSAAQQQAAE